MKSEPVDPVRRRIMKAIGNKDSKAELLVRSYLHRCGFRFRLHAGELRGRPDIVLPRWRAVVFVHGCFWHRHPGCPKASTPKTRRSFWLTKFERNVERDRIACDTLLADGWRIAVVWECNLVLAKRKEALRQLVVWLRTDLLTWEVADEWIEQRVGQRNMSCFEFSPPQT